MSKLINAIRDSETTFTENGMPTFVSSNNLCLDYFYRVGGNKNNPQASLNDFLKAYSEDADLAKAIWLWNRDIISGGGARNQFNEVLRYIGERPNLYPDIIEDISYIPLSGIGYWKDLFNIYTSTSKEMRASILKAVVMAIANKNGLCAKWLPRKGELFNDLRKILNITPKQLRKGIVGLTDVVEQKMCANKWGDIEYEKLPSIASSRYSKAFAKRDQARYGLFISKATKGEVKVNAGAIYPHQIIQSVNKGDVIAQAQWNNLPDYIKGSTEKILCMCDVSGSMTGEPMEVAMALSIYLSERSNSIFKDAFITFHSDPKLMYLKGDLKQKVSQLRGAPWGMSTDIEKAFKLVLSSAIKHSVPKDEMPTQILILSDMQFNAASKKVSAMGMIETMYKDAGYEVPKIVFWNLRTSSGIPEKSMTPNVALISGFSPSLMTSLLAGKDFSPVSIMIETVCKERYFIKKQIVQ